MAYVHLAHDVQLGSHTILANNATLAGHVHVDDWAIIGGLSGIHQFCHIGAHVMTGFQSHVSQDVPPFMTVSGNPLSVHGYNAEGLRRRGFSKERIGLGEPGRGEVRRHRLDGSRWRPLFGYRESESGTLIIPMPAQAAREGDQRCFEFSATSDSSMPSASPMTSPLRSRSSPSR
jgi:hypothetical protein